MDEIERKALRGQLEAMRLEHRDIDDSIIALSLLPFPDQIQLQRMKRRKLQLKDQITRLESLVIPDLDA